MGTVALPLKCALCEIGEPQPRRENVNLLTNVETRCLTHVVGFLPNTGVVYRWCNVNPVDLEACSRCSSI